MYKHLTREQRYAIYLGIQKEESYRAIAQAIGVSTSTISREVKRNSTRNNKFVWNKAQDHAESRKHRSPGNRATSAEIIWQVKQYIKEDQWSPKQISGYLATKEGIYISHETIYKLIRNDATGGLANNCRHKMIIVR